MPLENIQRNKLKTRYIDGTTRILFKVLYSFNGGHDYRSGIGCTRDVIFTTPQ